MTCMGGGDSADHDGDDGRNVSRVAHFWKSWEEAWPLREVKDRARGTRARAWDARDCPPVVCHATTRLIGQIKLAGAGTLGDVTDSSGKAEA